MKNITKLFIRSPEPYIDPLKGYVEKDCYFKDLSEKVISLDKLNTIGFYRTQFESIPTVLDEIKSLENLYFYKNYGIISLKNIPKMKNLKRLSLDECTVIKVNRKIKRLKSLEVITLRFTDISEEELDKLKKYLPNVKVEFIIPEYKKYYQKT
ncbi:hypothetical protein HHH56_10885 [Flammeovirga yaeyamensis]|nr:hypothetical protein [Flammeovirga yaeyamensis]